MDREDSRVRTRDWSQISFERETATLLSEVTTNEGQRAGSAGTVELSVTVHARQAMAERLIPLGWVERVVNGPELRTDDPTDPEVERFFGRLPERGDRVLRVAVNTRVEPWRVVSVFFDRDMRGQL